MIKNKFHLQILKKIKGFKSKSDKKERLWVQKYLGSLRHVKCIKSISMKEFAKVFLKENDLSSKEFIALLDSLYKLSTTFEEIDIAARLLNISPKIKEQLDLKHLDKWLNYTHGWAEIDLLCQSNFESKYLLSNWDNWKKLLSEFNKSPKVAKRRASLVLLVTSLRQSDDPRFSKLILKNINNLKSEKEILITKAVSWGLRALVKHHPEELKIYLEKNKESLPKIAYREAFTKVTTGRKYNRKS
jgi:3-methyladenine DNA glycosylase AlkD